MLSSQHSQANLTVMFAAQQLCAETLLAALYAPSAFWHEEQTGRPWRKV